MDNDDLRNRLEFLFSESASGPGVEESKNGSLLKEIVTHLLGDESDPEPIAAEPTLEVATPSSFAGPEMEGERDIGEAAADPLVEDQAPPMTVAGEPPGTSIPTGETHMIDNITMIDVAEEAVSLPAQSSDHPLYQEVEAFINQGNWQAAQVPLTELLSLYPHDPYLREIAASLHARSRLLESAHEPRPARRPILARSMRFVIPAVIIVALLGLAAVVLLALQLWILPQTTEQRQIARISQIRQEAQVALASGDYDRAILAYNEILGLLPDDPEAKDGLEQASQLGTIASLYSEAIAQMEAHHWESALSLLQQIQAQQPDYRDVGERIVFVQKEQDLSARFSQAEAAFERSDYELAVQAYEALQSSDYGFQRETVQDHLFLSYLQLGLAEEAAAGSNLSQLQTALDKFEKALALRPDDAQAKGETQLLRLYLASLDEFKSGNWSQAVASLTPVYEARPDFAAGAAAQRLYEAKVALGDELLAEGDAGQARLVYVEARLIKGADTTGLDQKIAAAEQMLVTPTPTPSPEPTQAASEAAPAQANPAPAPPPTATPVPLPYSLKGMSVKSNCNGYGYIHGVIWSVYNLPLAGISVQAFNTTTGFGPLVSLPTNEDGIYQIVLEKDQIDGLWVVQVLENGQVASQAWGQHIGGGCTNGAQELKVDWQRVLATN
jgi:tetratricopeptide (TPR) repeat protein